MNISKEYYDILIRHNTELLQHKAKIEQELSQCKLILIVALVIILLLVIILYMGE